MLKIWHSTHRKEAVDIIQSIGGTVSHPQKAGHNSMNEDAQWSLFKWSKAMDRFCMMEDNKNYKCFYCWLKF